MERLSTWSKSLTGSKPLFVFDLDSTITKCELLPLIARSIGLENEMRALTEASMHGNIPFEQNFRKRVGLLECVSVSQARSIAAKQPLHETMRRSFPEKTSLPRKLGLPGRLHSTIPAAPKGAAIHLPES